MLDSDKVCTVTTPLHIVYMNWIDSNSRVKESVTLGSCKINRLLFRMIWYCLLLDRGFKMHLTGLQLRATKRGRRYALEKTVGHHVSTET